MSCIHHKDEEEESSFKCTTTQVEAVSYFLDLCYYALVYEMTTKLLGKRISKGTQQRGYFKEENEEEDE